MRSFQNPDTVRETGSFKIQIYDSYGSELAASSGTGLILGLDDFSPAEMNLFEVSPHNKIIQEPSGMLVVMQPSEGMSETAQI